MSSRKTVNGSSISETGTNHSRSRLEKRGRCRSIHICWSLALNVSWRAEAQQARCSPSWSQASLVGATASIWASGSGSRSVRSWNSRRAPSPRYTPSGIPSLPTCGSWVSGKICKTPSPATRKAPTWADVTARSDSYMRPSARCPDGRCLYGSPLVSLKAP